MEVVALVATPQTHLAGAGRTYGQLYKASRIT
jgi:hypothetical protein